MYIKTFEIGKIYYMRDTSRMSEEKERIVKAVMEELQLRGGSKKRLLEKLVDEFGYDEGKVKYKAKRAFITERYEREKAREREVE